MKWSNSNSKSNPPALSRTFCFGNFGVIIWHTCTLRIACIDCCITFDIDSSTDSAAPNSVEPTLHCTHRVYLWIAPRSQFTFGKSVIFEKRLKYRRFICFYILNKKRINLLSYVFWFGERKWDFFMYYRMNINTFLFVKFIIVTFNSYLRYVQIYDIIKNLLQILVFSKMIYIRKL